MAPVETAPVILAGSGLHIHIADTLVLDREDIILREGERVGLVGRNGVGKSTLLKVLAGEEAFFTGDISRRRDLRSAYLPQEIALDPQHTIRDAILEAARTWTEMRQRFELLPHGSAEAAALEAKLTAAEAWHPEHRLERLTTALGTPAPERRIGSLSGGEKRRVALCRALISSPDLLLLDEPTNHLDTEAIEWLERQLSRSQSTLLFVTHDRAFLDRVATRILEIAWGRLHSYAGNYSTFLRRKAEREAAAEIQEARRLAFIRREADWIGRGPKARGTKSQSRLQRFRDAVETPTLQQEEDIDLVIPPPARLGNIVVVLDALTVTLGGRTLIHRFSHDFEPGARLGIVGANGSGKTTLLNVILGRIKPDAGTVRVGERTHFNYLDQHRNMLDGSKTVFEEVGEGKEFVALGKHRATIWAYLKRFLFTDDEIHTRVDQLSGGERGRLMLAKMLKRGGNFLILDEPTNDLDLSTLRVLEEALATFAGCVVVVSHDRYFLNRICTGILAFEGDGLIRYEPGDYDDYARKRRQREAKSTPAAAVRDGGRNHTPRTASKPRKLTYGEKLELEGIEERILAAETLVAEIEAIFSTPDFHTKHGGKIQELTAELEEKRDQVATLYERWEELDALPDK